MTGDGAPVILVADDEADIRSLVRYRLDKAGYEVVLAEDGEQALALAAERRPDLAILDVMMPKLTGIEVAKALRDREETKDVPIILLTARVQDGDVERGFEAGADDYVKKPFSPQDLHSRVEAILGRARER